MIHRHLGDISSTGRLAPRGKDEWTGDDEVDKPVCPPPSTTARQKTSLVCHLVRVQVYKGTDRLVKVRRYRAMRTPMGIITRNATPISKAWVLTFFSYSVRDMVSREVSRRVVGTEERARHRVYYDGMINRILDPIVSAVFRSAVFHSGRLVTWRPLLRLLFSVSPLALG
jgi:hypothetical protein